MTRLDFSAFDERMIKRMFAFPVEAGSMKMVWFARRHIYNFLKLLDREKFSIPNYLFM